MGKTLTLIRLRLSRLWWVMILISAAGTGLGYTWWHFDFLEMSDDERNSYDDGLKKFTNKPWFPWGAQPMSEDIVLLAIDDRSFIDIGAYEGWRDRYGSWPYDRIIWADIVSYLGEAGAKIVVLDVTLSEPKADITGDQKMGEAFRDAKTPTVMGFGAEPLVAELPKVEKPLNKKFVMPEAKKEEPAPEGKPGDAPEEFPSDEFPSEPDPAQVAKENAEKAQKLREAAALAYAFPVKYEGVEPPPLPTVSDFALPDGGVASGDDLKRGGLISVERQRYPVPALPQVIDVTTGFGIVEPEADEDGKMRGTSFVYNDGKNDYLTLALAAAADYYDADSVTIGEGVMSIGTHRVRINKDGTARINYGGKQSQRFPSVMLADVLRYKGAPKDSALGKEGIDRFKGKVVFIGATGQGTGDQKPTPFNAFEPGVVKQMATFDNIIHDRFILEAALWQSILLAFLVALFSVALVMVAQSVVTDIGAPVFLYFAFFVITGSFISVTNIHILSAMPGMAGTLAAVAATAFNRFFASKDRDFMRQAFSAYMEQDLVEQMVEGKKLPALDGEEIEVTAFFSDIKGFSTFSEALKDEPKRLMKLLNRYLSTVTPILKGEGACIDKYIGDAVVALFGAPVHYDDHALRACHAALEVQKAVGELRKAFAAEGLPDVYTRIGLNTDKMLVGNIGSDDLLDYTALGDGMNLAARLEGTNKAYETLILIGPQTFEATRGKVVTRELDSIRVAGKTEAIAVYELVGLEGMVHAHKRQIIELYAKALELYRHRRFADSLKTLKEAYDIDRTDGPIKVLAAKCNHFMQHPPPSDWDGVTQLEK